MPSEVAAGVSPALGDRLVGTHTTPVGCGQRNVARIWFFGILPMLAACSIIRPQPDRSRFFVLTPVAGAADSAASNASQQLSLGLGPIEFPGYLKRDEIATRVSATRIDFSETDRWAEPLNDNFRRVLARDLSALLATDQIVQFPWYSSTALDYKIAVDVERFDRDAAGGSNLTAHWVIRDGKNNRLLITRDAVIDQPVHSAETASAVSALSQDVAQLSREIASALRQLRNSPQEFGRSPRAALGGEARWVSLSNGSILNT